MLEILCSKKVSEVWTSSRQSRLTNGGIGTACECVSECYAAARERLSGRLGGSLRGFSALA